MKISEIIFESHSSSHVGDDTDSNGIPDSHETATPGMRTHTKLDNSSPYHPWRFAAYFLGGAGDKSGEYEHEPKKDGPNGQSLVAAAYSEGERAILDQASKAFGHEANYIQLTSDGSHESDFVHNVSPVKPRAPVSLNRKKPAK